MPRPDRPWIKNSYTVSPEVDQAIRARAAALGVDTGTALDAIVWDALLKPTKEQVQDGSFTDDQLERMFAEEALQFLAGEQEIRHLAEQLNLAETPGSSLRKTRALVKRWQKMRRIDKDHQEALLSALGDGRWIPSILRYGQVEHTWFQPQDWFLSGSDDSEE